MTDEITRGLVDAAAELNIPNGPARVALADELLRAGHVRNTAEYLQVLKTGEPRWEETTIGKPLEKPIEVQGRATVSVLQAVLRFGDELANAGHAGDFSLELPGEAYAALQREVDPDNRADGIGLVMMDVQTLAGRVRVTPAPRPVRAVKPRLEQEAQIAEGISWLDTSSWDAALSSTTFGGMEVRSDPRLGPGAAYAIATDEWKDYFGVSDVLRGSPDQDRTFFGIDAASYTQWKSTSAQQIADGMRAVQEKLIDEASRLMLLPPGRPWAQDMANRHLAFATQFPTYAATYPRNPYEWALDDQAAEVPTAPPMLPPLPVETACECGAYKATGAERGSSQHSSWCPWKEEP